MKKDKNKKYTRKFETKEKIGLFFVALQSKQFLS